MRWLRAPRHQTVQRAGHEGHYLPGWLVMSTEDVSEGAWFPTWQEAIDFALLQSGEPALRTFLDRLTVDEADRDSLDAWLMERARLAEIQMEQARMDQVHASRASRRLTREVAA